MCWLCVGASFSSTRTRRSRRWSGRGSGRNGSSATTMCRQLCSRCLPSRPAKAGQRKSCAGWSEKCGQPGSGFSPFLIRENRLVFCLVALLCVTELTETELTPAFKGKRCRNESKNFANLFRCFKDVDCCFVDVLHPSSPIFIFNSPKEVLFSPVPACLSVSRITKKLLNRSL